MSLFIAQTDGATKFRVLQAQVDLISITKVDPGLGFIEDATQDIEGVTTIPVTYTQSETGPTPTRISDLVNNTGGVVTPPRIVIFAVDDSFTLSDGTPLAGNGVAIPPGGSGNPFTANIAAFYDVTLCGGSGVWVDKEGGGTTQESSEVVLYHELSHCFHFDTGTTAPTSEQEEVAAETDENDMRDVLGYAHRDVNSHNGGCGGGPAPSCCIIASLATGSPYSSEIAAFRHYREQTLRGSEVGDDFFRRFFHSYYAFSPEVVRVMGRNPDLSDLVRERYVLPLLAALEMLIHYADSRGRGLAGLLHAQLDRPGCEEFFSVHQLERLVLEVGTARSVLDDGAHGTSGEPGSPIAELAAYIRGRTVDDRLLRWALVDVVGLWATSLLRVHAGAPDEVVDAEARGNIASWIAQLPVSTVWTAFSRPKADEELRALDQFLFDPEARSVFAARLGTTVPAHADTATRWAARTIGVG
jgi:hypothetical protein